MRMKMDVKVCVWAIVGLLAAGTAWAQDGSIVGWGSQVVGVDLSADFVAVAGGGPHSLGLKSDGSIVAWGWNDHGQCDVPAPNTEFVAVAAGYHHSLGIKGVPPIPTVSGWGLVVLTLLILTTAKLLSMRRWPARA